MVTQEVINLMSYTGDLFIGILDSAGMEPSYMGYRRQLVEMSTPAMDYKSDDQNSVFMYNTSEVIFACDNGHVTITHIGFYTMVSGDSVAGDSLIIRHMLNRPITANSGDTICFSSGSLDSRVGAEDWLARVPFSTTPTTQGIVLTGRNVRVRSHGEEKDQTETKSQVSTRRIRTMGRRQSKGGDR